MAEQPRSISRKVRESMPSILSCVKTPGVGAGAAVEMRCPIHPNERDDCPIHGEPRHYEVVIMKKRFTRVGVVVVVLGLVSITAFAGTQGTVVVRPFGDSVNITIDGRFDDWPLDGYEQLSEQPFYPDGENYPDEVVPVDARGDWIKFDIERVGSWCDLPLDIAVDDFGVNTYFAYDSEFLYVLSIVIDDYVQDSHPSANDGISVHWNDGIEFFFDPKNDSEYCISTIEFPKIDTVEPYSDDIQITTTISFLWGSVIPEDQGGLGSVIGIERSGNLANLGEGAAKFDAGAFQDALAATDGPDIAALLYGDLRAAGAPNPAIDENPDITFSGFVMEMRIPFGFTEGFTPDHEMAWFPFWRDVDDETLSFIPWTQSSGSGCSAGFVSIWNAKSWGALVFNTDNPLGVDEIVNVDHWSIY